MKQLGGSCLASHIFRTNLENFQGYRLPVPQSVGIIKIQGRVGCLVVLISVETALTNVFTHDEIIRIVSRKYIPQP